MLGSMSIEKSENKINSEEVSYWRRMIRSNLKIGVEIETCLANGVSNSTCRNDLTNTFDPSGSFGRFGKYGVLEVKGDGSLTNGIELCTIGRRISFIDLYNQYSAIIKNIMKYNPKMNSRAGLHNHMLMDYTNNYNCLEKPIPSVIFKNFMQLIKRHLPELVYLTSTVNEKLNGQECITRMDYFCTADTLLKTTPLTRTTSDFITKLTEPGSSAGRYKFVNLRNMAVAGDNDSISKFHLELRFPDGSIYPAQIACQNILYTSILLKAVEISELGIINCGNAELWEETKTLYASIRNHQSNYGDYRVSIPPTAEQLARIKERCSAMLLEFKPIIDSFDTHTYALLKILADKPISLLRREKSDTEINEMFGKIIENMYKINLTECMPVIELISLNKCIGFNDEGLWLSSVARKTGILIETLKKIMFTLKTVKQLEFDKEIGSYVFK
jgi:hypothetical protein